MTNDKTLPNLLRWRPFPAYGKKKSIAILTQASQEAYAMNYFSHALPHLHTSYFLAGLATPDWLGVIHRRIRARSKAAQPFLEDSDPRMAALAAGVIRHHEDDRWFHQTRAFVELNLQFSRLIGETLPDDHGFRPYFLGHVLIELLLDAELIADEPQQLTNYYAAIEELDPEFIEEGVSRMTSKPAVGLAVLVRKFCQHRFLYDYAEDAKLRARLNSVMRRVGFPELPESFLEILPETRQTVRRRRDELLAAPPTTD